MFFDQSALCVSIFCGSFSIRSVSDHLLQKYFYIIITIVLYVYHNHTHPVLKKKTLNHQLVSWQKINQQLFWLIMFIWVTLSLAVFILVFWLDCKLNVWGVLNCYLNKTSDMKWECEEQYEKFSESKGWFPLMVLWWAIFVIFWHFTEKVQKKSNFNIWSHTRFKPLELCQEWSFRADYSVIRTTDTLGVKTASL